MNNTPLPLPNPTDWLTTNAAAFLLGVHPRTVARMVKAGTLREYRPYGGPRERVTPFYWRPEVNALVDARLVSGAARRGARTDDAR